MVGGDERTRESEEIQVREAESDHDRMGESLHDLFSFNREEQDISIRKAV